MSDPRISTVLRQAARLTARPGATTSDSVLLDRFIRTRDEVAFAEIVTRHGPAVWGLCRRLLRTEADAEDVFQATFLVLARKASRVRKAASVGSWLYGVAFRLGRRARARLDRPPPGPAGLTPREAPPGPADSVTWAEVRAVLDEELARLPDALRAPLLLCYFEGLTQDEAATALGWNTRTLKARVARGREMLRTRLTRRGVELPAALATPLLSAGLSSAVPTNIATAAVGMGCRSVRDNTISPAALALAQTEASTMTAVRLAVCVSMVALLAGAAMLGLRAGPTEGPQPEPKVATPAAPTSPPIPGAIVIGTSQFRHVGWHSRAFLTDNGNTLLLVEGGGAVRFWDVETGQARGEVAVKGNRHDAAFAPIANLLAIVGAHEPDADAGKWEAVLWLIDVATRKIVHTVELPGNSRGNRQQVQISADGKRVFVGVEGDIRILDGKTGQELLRHKSQINASTIAASPDGKMVAFGRHEIFLWRWESGEEPKPFTRLGGFGTELIQFSPDGKTLIIVPSGGLITTWDVATGRQTGSMVVRTMPRSLSFSPDGKTLAIGDGERIDDKATDHPISLRDATTGNEVKRLSLGRQYAGHVSWSKDGDRLAAVSDYRAWVWDVKTGKQLAPTRPGHEGLIAAMEFGPDGTLFTASDDHTIRTWAPAPERQGWSWSTTTGCGT